MRNAKLAIILTLLSSASGAVVAVETGNPSATAIERPDPQQLASAHDSTSTTSTTSTSTVWDTVTVWLSASATSIYSTTSSTSSTSNTSTPTSTSSNLGVLHHENIVTSDADVTQTIVETIVITVIAQPVVTDYINLANAAGWLAHDLNHHGTADSETRGTDDPNPNIIHRPDDLEAPRTKRNVVYERDTIIESSFVTQFTTSIIPASTMYVRVIGSPPSPATGTSFSTLAYAVPVSLGIPYGVLVTTVTSVVTVTSGPTEQSHAVGSSNETATLTESWLNISTFVATGLATWTGWPTWPVGHISTATHPTTNYPSTTTTSERFQTSTISKPQTTDEQLPGFSGAQIATLHHNGVSKMVDVGGLPIPIAMIVAMATCFALALLL